MSNKPKYSIGETVKIKATGEKVSIVDVDSRLYVVLYGVHELSGLFSAYFEESELKPYRPSRTGKYRDSRGKFISKGYVEYLKEIDNKLKFERIDSKQRNYQNMSKLKSPDNYYDKQEWFDQVVIRVNYLIRSMERIEKKIDELGRRV